MALLTVSDAFDGGAIEVVDAARAGDVQLRLRADNAADFRQWFYFRVQGARGQDLQLRFLNAGEASYAPGWEGYRVCASYDRQQWFRIDTDYDGKQMRARLKAERDSVYFAYFEPYTWERHLDFLGFAEGSGRACVKRLGRTVDGRDLDQIVVGPEDAARHVWIIARQHPGETMAEWWVEGFVERLLDANETLARRLRGLACLHIVPNMNPDGGVRGNLRTNAAGANLNREWMAPSLERSPEVHAVRAAIQASGCALFLDIHGDEVLPYVFYAGSEMLPGFTAQQAAAQKAFSDWTLEASPDFQDKMGYEAGKYSADALKLASKYVGHTFGCVSLTLEMPFKDNADRPDRVAGWSAARSKELGAAMVLPVLRQMEQEP
jgi:murein tripeptide amidase MpaA